ncbi:MAG: mono/diheme cytochrome c family protein [Myxococcota bacterium]|jgi:mono/diheme cytochrome c family protein
MRAMVMVGMLVVLAGCGSKDGDSGDTAAATGTATGTATGGTATGGTASRSGEEVFGSICIACHAADGHGTAAGPDLEPLIAALDDAGIADVALNGKGNMDPMPVNEEEALAVAAYIRTLF